MSREVRRVPVGFDWPLDKTWSGYLMPEDLQSNDCPACGGGGYSPDGKRLNDIWYGNAPFRPTDNGSTPLTVDTPAVRAFAERNVSHSPDFYVRGEAAIRREAFRLIRMWNGQWCHHLNDDDVAALLAEDRLREFTHTCRKGDGWRRKDPAVVPTAAQVNEWSLGGFGHDSINSWVVIRARAAREGLALECSTCGGSGAAYRDDSHKAAHDAWEPTEPPTGEAWQLWETTSEGSPVTPPFETAEALVEHLVAVGEDRRDPPRPWSRKAAEAMVRDKWAPSGIAIGGKTYQNADALVAMDEEASK